jgi:hypothetical protein
MAFRSRFLPPFSGSKLSKVYNNQFIARFIMRCSAARLAKESVTECYTKINVPYLEPHQTLQMVRQLNICEGTFADLVAYLCNN